MHLGFSGAATGAAAAPPSRLSRSITERTWSRALRSRTASSSGAAAPERRIRLCASGSMIGSSHRPCTTNGNSNTGGSSALAATSAAVPFRSRSRSGIEAEPPSARRIAPPSSRTSSTLAVPSAMRSVTLSFSNGVRPRRKSAGDRERTLLQPLEQLLDIEARDGALPPGQARGAGHGLGQRQHAVARGFDRERERALALEPAQPEQLAETGFEVDVGELQLRFDVDAVRRLGERHGAFQRAAERLRFADRDREAPVAQVGGDPGAAEPRGRDRDARRREAQVEIEIGEPVDRDRAAVPVALARAQQLDGRQIGREIERVGGERALHGHARLAAECQHAFRHIAVELDVRARQHPVAAGEVRLRLQGERADPAARQRLPAAPAHRLAQRFSVDRERALDLQRRALADMAVEGELERGAREPHLQAGAVARQRGEQVGRIGAGVERRLAPDEPAARAETARDRRPGERQFHVGQLLHARRASARPPRWCRRSPGSPRTTARAAPAACPA